MTTHIALLRGINVGGRTNIAMADLRQVFAGLGCEEVRTYLRSGNVVFGCADSAVAGLAAAVEQRVARDLGVSTTVLLRTAGELARVVAGNPFLDEESDLTRLHVGFLSEPPGPQARLSVPGQGRERFRLAGRELFLHYPDGVGRSRFTNAHIEKQLGVAATARNWRTVLALAEMTR
ncbi:DUF1697 domain-containing protein [Saccharopolyspora taberi]|uniref:DUF1697 domain-containing protein n=1 Tax=Saccharopolyspora taberi TaxID=60895 RepID=A0ABN3VDY0_9PSEU